MRRVACASGERKRLLLEGQVEKAGEALLLAERADAGEETLEAVEIGLAFDGDERGLATCASVEAAMGLAKGERFVAGRVIKPGASRIRDGVVLKRAHKDRRDYARENEIRAHPTVGGVCGAGVWAGAAGGRSTWELILLPPGIGWHGR